MNKQLANKLKELPKGPGVYFHKSAAGEIIYVGKAAVLRNRVRQYFQKSRLRDTKTDALVAEIQDVDWMEVESELEALFLEAEMVRRYMPRYNILLRDDKAMSYIRIDYDSDYPTVTTTRHPLDDKARYYGPYFSAYQIKQALRLLRRIFPYAVKKSTGQKRASLHYHIGLDPGLESGKTSLEDYRKNLKRLMSVIEGKKQGLVRELEKEMKRFAGLQQYEEASRLRNQLASLKELGRQVLFSDKEFSDISKDKALTQLQGLLGLKSPPRRIEGYDISHMSGTNVVGSMVVFVNGVSKRDEYRKFKISVQRNDDYASMQEIIKRRFSDKNQKKWGLPSLLLIDGGTGQLSAATRSLKDQGIAVPIIGVAKREEELVISRTDSNISAEMLDKLSKEPVAGVTVIPSGDYYFVNLHVGQSNAGSHSKNLRGGFSASPYIDTVKLLQRIRDEAHRFAVSYHTVLKRSGSLKSGLDDIPGVGPVLRKKLIKSFGSFRGVKEADKTALESAVGAKTGQIIHRWLHDKDDPEKDS